MDAGGAAAIAIVVVLVLVLWVLSWCIYIVHQAEAIVVERFGRFHRVLSPGLSFVIPLMDSPRTFTWRKTYVDVDGQVRDEHTTSYRVDLREALFDFVKQEVYSKDTVLLEVDTVMYYRITDVRRAIYEVDDLESAIQNTAQSQLKRIFGGLTFVEALASQETINTQLKTLFRADFEKWGLQVERIELQDLRPKGNTATAMKAQMIAERARRSEFIAAEGNKSAMRLISEGAKIVKANLGVAEQEATRKRSEGSASAKIELARAEKASLDTIAEAVAADGCGQTDFMISKRFNELLRSIPSTGASDGAAGGKGSKTVYLPYEVSSISGLIAGLPAVYGRKAATAALEPEPAPGGSGTGLRARPGRGAGAAAGAFPELD